MRIFQDTTMLEAMLSLVSMITPHPKFQISNFITKVPIKTNNIKTVKAVSTNFDVCNSYRIRMLHEIKFNPRSCISTSLSLISHQSQEFFKKDYQFPSSSKT